MFRAKNAPNPTEFEQSYTFDITKYYRIWFSDNPNVFLGVENELRFIRMRQNNPSAVISFIFSASALNDAALAALKTFCTKHSIHPVDFDTVIPTLLNHQSDVTLYNIAKSELIHALNNDNGNLAAAADCVRLLSPVIENFGIYTDFDVECNLTMLDVDNIQIKAPLLLNAEIKSMQGVMCLLNPNSDFLAFSFNPANPKKMSPSALKALRYIQDAIILNYTQPITINTFFCKNDLNNNQVLPVLQLAFKLFSELHIETPSIFDFRKFLKAMKLPGLSDQDNQSIGNYLYSLSVISISGPGTYYSVYRNLVPVDQTIFPIYLPCTANSGWRDYLDMVRRSSITYYDLICDHIQSGNTMTNAEKITAPVDPGTLCDLSWTEKGKAFKKSREIKICEAARVVQGFWRRKIDVHQAFLAVSRDAISVNTTKPLTERHYSLALRKASAELNIELVSLLLRWKNKLNLQLNETSSNGNTALDWAYQAKGRPDRIKQLTELLIQNGAATSEALRKRR